MVVQVMVDDRPRQWFPGATFGFEKVLKIPKRNVQNTKQKAPEIPPEMRFALCFEKRQSPGNSSGNESLGTSPNFRRKTPKRLKLLKEKSDLRKLSQAGSRMPENVGHSSISCGEGQKTLPTVGQLRNRLHILSPLCIKANFKGGGGC